MNELLQVLPPCVAATDRPSTHTHTHTHTHILPSVTCRTLTRVVPRSLVLILSRSHAFSLPLSLLCAARVFVNQPSTHVLLKNE